MANVVLILLLGAALAAGLAWVVRILRGLGADWSSQLAERNAEVDRRLLGVTETMDRRLAELDTKVDRRLESASQTTNRIHERLGKVDDGTTVTFRVVRVSRMPKSSFPTDLVYLPTLQPSLQLVTCGGSFDHDARSYRDNVIVYTVPP